MKAILLLISITAILLCSNPTYAQRIFNFGVEGGVNKPNYYGKTIRKDQVFFMGFHLGINVQTALTDAITVQSGLRYTQKGTKYENVMERSGPGSLVPDMGPLSNRYHFIELPIHGIYQFSGPLKNMYAGVGPYFGYLTGVTARTDEKKTKIDMGDNDYYKRFDVGLSLLAGYKVSEKLSVQLGLKNGFMSISKTKDINIRHRSIELSVRYNLFNK